MTVSVAIEARLRGQRRRHPRRSRGGSRATGAGGVHLDRRRAVQERGADATPRTSHPGAARSLGASKWAGSPMRRHGRARTASRTPLPPRQRQGRARARTGEAGVVAIFSLQIWRGEQPNVFGDGRTDARLRPRRRRAALFMAHGQPASSTSRRRRDRRHDALRGAAAARAPRFSRLLAPLRAASRAQLHEPTRARETFGWRARSSCARAGVDLSRPRVGVSRPTVVAAIAAPMSAGEGEHRSCFGGRTLSVPSRSRNAAARAAAIGRP